MNFVGVPGLANQADMIDFVNDRGVGAMRHIPDEAGVIWDRFGVIRQRTYVLINDDGTVRVTGYGNLEQDVIGLINS